MSKKVFAALSFALLLGACNTSADLTVDDEAVMEDDSAVVEDNSAMMDESSSSSEEAMMDDSSSSSEEAMEAEGDVEVSL